MEKKQEKTGSNLERTFDTLFRQVCMDMPQPEREFMFAKSIGRRWLFDRAWPEVKIAVELEGGVYTEGRHTRGKGFEGDCEKYNTAQAMGWVVLRFTSNMLRIDPHKHLKLVEYCLTSFTGNPSKIEYRVE